MTVLHHGVPDNITQSLTVSLPSFVSTPNWFLMFASMKGIRRSELGRRNSLNEFPLAGVRS